MLCSTNLVKKKPPSTIATYKKNEVKTIDF